jgi:CRP-like cAMP-binding protein
MMKKFVRKLERRITLPAVERDALLGLQTHVRQHHPHVDIVTEGDRTTSCVMIESGLVSRTKTLHDGARQIVAFGIPGDMVDLQSLLFQFTDHGIHTHTPTVTLSVTHKDILGLAASSPILARALWLDTLIDAAIFREWTVNVGQRNARMRMAHLLLEFAARFESIGMTNGKTYELPLSQTSMADALGMSIVHVNRTLQWLRGKGFIKTRGRYVTIVHDEEMRAFAGFNQTYLHLGSYDQPALAKPAPQPSAATAVASGEA